MRFLTTTCLLLATTGCVSKKKYTALEDQLSMRDAELADARSSLGEMGKDKAEMERALKEMRARNLMAQGRIEEYRKLARALQAMTDAGKLEVKVVDGRMVVGLRTDVLFPSGSAKLSDEGKATIAELGSALATLDVKGFQVEGHTDTVPIKTKQYPSNWELASARAVSVVNVLQENGVPPEKLSAASFSQYKPTAMNSTDDGKAQNRRIEVVLLPDMSLLPGYQELNQLAGGGIADKEPAPPAEP
jgi:chemotaxis protein MotB